MFETLFIPYLYTYRQKKRSFEKEPFAIQCKNRQFCNKMMLFERKYNYLRCKNTK